MTDTDSDSQGFDSDYSAESIHLNDHQTVREQKHIKNKIDEPLDVISKPYSLQPDMMFGWMPKIPSIPIPLNYGDSLNQIKMLVKNDKRYKIAYLQDNESYNTVKLHQRYHYKWNDRSKYQMKIGFIEQAVQKIGKNINTENYKIENCQFNFFSKFQSGNLAFAVRIRAFQYDLYLRNDSNTKGHTNWYYFQVQNRDQLGIVQFNICNLKKTKNLYGKGMQPFILQNQHSQWKQGLCSEVNFVQRYCRHRQESKIHQLQFKYKFCSPNMKVRFAYCIPYTYSKLQNFILGLKSSNLNIQNLGYSSASLEIPLLKITDEQISSHLKKTFIIVGRTHPGQSNSSFVLEGLIRELLLNNEQTSYLRKSYIFYVVPMLNVDGTVLGNFRCGVKGTDLNRQFYKRNQEIQQVAALQNFVEKIKQKGQKIQFFCDFHGHSSKTNFFAYGPEHDKKSVNYTKSNVFLKLMAQKLDNFKYSECILSIPKYKKHTARAYMLREENIPMSFTFQISNGVISSQKSKYYNEHKFIYAGRSFIKGIYQYKKSQQQLQMLLKIKKNCFYIKKNNLLKRGSLSIQKQSFQRSFDQLKRRNTYGNNLLVNNTQISKQLIRSQKLKKLLSEISQKENKNQAHQQAQSDMESQQEDLTQKQKKAFKQNIELWKSKFTKPKLFETISEKNYSQIQNKLFKTTSQFIQQNKVLSSNTKKEYILKQNQTVNGYGHKKLLKRSISNLIASKINNSTHLKSTDILNKKSKRKTIDLKMLGKNQATQNHSALQSPFLLKQSLAQSKKKQFIIEQLQISKSQDKLRTPIRLQKKNLQSATVLLRSKRFPLANTNGSFLDDLHS